MEASTSGKHQDEEVQQEDPQQPPSPPPHNNQEEEDDGEDEEEAPQQPSQKLSRVRARVKKNHPVELIMDNTNSGRITRYKSRLANFCEHYSFISSIEPMKV
jgi:hypothetical protein